MMDVITALRLEKTAGAFKAWKKGGLNKLATHQRLMKNVTERAIVEVRMLL
jgi:hypothetical protein